MAPAIGTATSSGLPGDDDDFFGDQSEDTHDEQQRQAREVEAVRRLHVNSGIREGANDAREAHLQQGFDAGFAAGAKAAAEPGFLLGACTLLEALLNKAGGQGSRSQRRSVAIGDTEVPVQNIRDVEDAARQLRIQIRDMVEGAPISIDAAKSACEKVAVFGTPQSITAPSQQSESVGENSVVKEES